MNALIYLGANKDNWTVSLGLNAMRVFEGPIRWDLIMAYTVVMILPVLLVFAFGQRNIIQGTTTTGIKG